MAVWEFIGCHARRRRVDLAGLLWPAVATAGFGLVAWLLASAPAAGEAPTRVRIDAGSDVRAIVAAHPPGTTFVLGAGIHRLQSVVPRDGDTFEGEPGATMRGSRVLDAFEPAGRLWIARGQTQQANNTGLCRPWGPDEPPVLCTYPEQLFIDGQRLTPVDAPRAVDALSYHFDYERDAIYIGVDPAGRLVETSVTERAFSGTARDVTIRGLVIEHYANRSQTGAVHGAKSAGWTVEANEIRLNHGHGIRTGPGMVVRGNRVHHQGQLGIGGAGDGVLVAGNEIAFNNQAGFAPGWEAGGTKFVKSDGLVVRDNWVHRNVGRGIWTDIDVINARIEGNVVEWNTSAGIVHEISYRATIRGNVSRFNGIERDEWLWGAQILVQNGRDVVVSRNLAVVHEDGGDGIAIINQDRGDGEYGPRASANVTVSGNTVVHLGSVGHSGVVDDVGPLDPACGEAAGNRFEDNAYFLGHRSGRRWEWCGARTWLEMQALGLEANGRIRAGSTAGIRIVGAACCSDRDWPMLLALHHTMPGVRSFEGGGAGVLVGGEPD
ncbi:MAG: right-handed parallel beta-helix repeat-containing protein [Dehalococcoidia bacterium]|nr:right-handed parallel beta-helix repeat-containing protein [Dehalococcoidia bacterium]